MDRTSQTACMRINGRGEACVWAIQPDWHDAGVPIRKPLEHRFAVSFELAAEDGFCQHESNEELGQRITDLDPIGTVIGLDPHGRIRAAHQCPTAPDALILPQKDELLIFDPEILEGSDAILPGEEVPEII